jgi:osmotically-inducible protein OsmY
MDTDRRIQREVENELAWEADIDGTKVHASVDDGIAVLAGEVPTVVERYRAENAALRVKGVRAVADELIVEAAASEARSAQIARAALNALSSAVPRGGIKVAVHGSVVKLDGHVECDHERTAAIRAMEDLPGVKEVVSMITVRPPLTPRDVENRIADAVPLVARGGTHEIRAEIDGARVTLLGSVPTQRGKDEAGRVARSLPGISDVRNLITVVMVALVVLVSCAESPGRPIPVREPVPTSDPETAVTVRVSNNNWATVLVYAVNLGESYRLGSVQTGMTATFSLSKRFLDAGDLELSIRPIGSPTAYGTGRILFAPGESIELTVENTLELSSFVVY